MIIYEKSEKKIEIPNGLGTEITINVVNDCPEPEDITITENGVYEGLYDRVEVNVEQGGGEEVNLQNEKIVRPSSTDELISNNLIITPDEGYDGMKQVVAELEDVLGQEYNRGYEDGIANGGSCDLFDEMIVYNGTYQPNLKYINLDGDDCFYSNNYYNSLKKIEIVFRPHSEGTIIGFYNSNPDDWWGIRMINEGQIYVRWGSRYGTFDVVHNEWNKVILAAENNIIEINGYGFILEQDDNQDNPSNGITIGGEYQGTYTTANYDFQYAVIYDNILNADSDYIAYIAEGENSIANTNYIGSGTATFYSEPKDGFRNVTVAVKPNLEDKWEYWNNPDERERYISASEGYDGMRQVYVSIDAALNAENQRGKVQGENEIKSLMTTLNVEKNGTYRANSFNVMDIDNDDAFEMDLGRDENSYYEIKFKINRNGSRIEGALLTVYKCDSEEWNGIFLDSDSQISFKWYDKSGTASIDPNGWNIIRFSPNNTDTSKRVWVNGRSVEVNEGATDNMDCTFGNMNIGGRSPYGLTTGAFDLAYVHYFMNYTYGWEEGHTPFYYLPEANNQISRCTYNGDGIAWLERDGEVGWNEVDVNVKTYPTFLENAINSVINKASQGMVDLDSQLDGKSSSGMMYIGAGKSKPVMTLQNFYLDGDLRENTETLVTFMCGTISSPSNNLIQPFVYTEGNSLGSIKVIAPYWYGGFDCTNVDVIENIFEGAEELEYMEELYNLGTSFTTSRILDLSGSNLNDEALRKISESLYDFTTPNQNGVSNGYVKFNSNVTAETKDLYTAKNWLLWA